jgi:hypothetical protein
MDMLHTFTSKRARGRGLAAVVTRAAFEYCTEEGLSVRPSCTYISERFMQVRE